MNRGILLIALMMALTLIASGCSPTPFPVQTAPQAPVVQPQTTKSPSQAQIAEVPAKAGFVDYLEIKSVTDAYGGVSFGSVGPYQVVSGIVHGKLSPTNPANTIIVDLDKAPVGADGYVEYTTDFVILRPKNPATAKRLLFYEVNNRGNKSALSTYFVGAGTNFEKGSEGDGFLYRQGYTVVWSGWQGDIRQTGLAGTGASIGTNFPVAKNKDGSAITGLSREENVFDYTESPTSFTLTYPAATLDKSQVTFNARKTWVTPNGMTWDSPAVNIPPSDWDYINEKQVMVKRPTSVDAGAIYSFVYPAKDPIVMGIGFAAVRDLVTFLKYDATDAKGTPNPLNDLKQAPCVFSNASQCASSPQTTVDVAIGEGVSQSGRFARDLLYHGFNDDTRGHKVFDGMMPIIPASRKTYTNFRWGQPGRWSKGHEDHFQPGDQFPFTYAVTTDPVSGATDGLMKRCLASNLCPKIMQVDGAFEVWGGRGSLLVVDSAGKEIPIPDNVRLYMVGGTQHGGGNGVGTETKTVACQNLSSAAIKRPVDRAMVVAMEAWLTKGTNPPDSRYPNLKDGTLAPQTSSRAQIGFPDLTKIGVNFPTVYNQLFVTDYSNAIPVANLSKQYNLYVPTTDADGNDIGGIRVPDMSVPIATYTGWNIRKAGFAEGDTCGSTGSTIPFAATLAARQASGDPRPSLQERYASKADYVAKVEAAAKALVAQGYLLPEDVTLFVNQAQKVTVLQ